MDLLTTQVPDKTRRLTWLRNLFLISPRIARSRRPKLDREVMSDYMKRDLGFLDGRGLRKDSDMTR